MKVLLVLAHPEEKSFNGAMFEAAKEIFSRNGHEVKTSDLYRMGFDPVSDRRNFKSVKDPQYFKQQVEEGHATESGTFADDVEAELKKLEWCDLLILQFPLWWFSMPAIMKGWVDRVFAFKRVYGSGKWYDAGVFAGKKAMLSLTTGGGEAMYEPTGVNGDLHAILYPINHGMLRFVGFDVLPSFISWSPAHRSAEDRAAELERYKETLSQIDSLVPIKYPALTDFDEHFKLKVQVTK
ncbi:MAG: NAD(P)H-dependent oxidoreductase [Cyanobacteria bacterium SZAS TMP-1]|nr:NAD(P)H-dependent oxidoreductase [Cyanobacteria bacterium SZAS TMP-1]